MKREVSCIIVLKSEEGDRLLSLSSINIVIMPFILFQYSFYWLVLYPTNYHYKWMSLGGDECEYLRYNTGHHNNGYKRTR